MLGKNYTNLIDKDHFMGYAVIGTDGRIVIADEIVFLFLGTHLSIDLIEYVHPNFKERFRNAIETCTESSQVILLTLRRYDGEYVHCSINMYATVSDGKQYINLSIFDVKYLTSAYNDFLIRNKIFNAYISISDKIFFEYSLINKKITVYDNKRNIYSGDFETYCDTMLLTKTISPDSMQQFRQMCDEISDAKGDGFYKLNTNFFAGENQADEFSPTLINYATIEFNSQPAYVVGIFTRTTSGSEGYSTYLMQQSSLDPLTNLLNKKAIKDYAIEALANAQKGSGNIVTFLMIDLDNFKAINDTYGHMFGDETLVTVARVMSDAVGERGVVGRIGGDEFFIVLTGFQDSDESIRPLIRSIRSHVEWSFKNKVADIKVTCSVGVASYPNDALNYDDLFKLADHCLYIAKSKGRDRFIIYTKSLHGSLQEILSNGTVIQMVNYVSEADKSKHLLTIIERFNAVLGYDQQRVMLKKVMLELLFYYNLDCVAYYPTDSNAPTYETANYTVNDSRTPVALYETYKDDIENKGLLTIGNYVNAESEYFHFYEFMLSEKLYSVMIIPSKNMEDELEGIFFVSTHQRYQKWANFDIRMLSIIFKLMERFVKN